MTQVDFYILSNHQDRAWLEFICRLSEKIYRKGHHILLHTDDEKQSDTIDDWLWTWRDGSFVPHEIQTDATAGDSPIIISHQPEPAHDAQDVLINMATAAPSFFRQFKRVAEVVGQNEQARQNARQRYRFYQSCDCEPRTHNIS